MYRFVACDELFVITQRFPKYLSGGYEVKENEPARTFVVDGAEDDLHESQAKLPDDEMP